MTDIQFERLNKIADNIANVIESKKEHKKFRFEIKDSSGLSIRVTYDKINPLKKRVICGILNRLKVLENGGKKLNLDDKCVIRVLNVHSKQRKKGINKGKRYNKPPHKTKRYKKVFTVKKKVK